MKRRLFLKASTATSVGIIVGLSYARIFTVDQLVAMTTRENFDYIVTTYVSKMPRSKQLEYMVKTRLAEAHAASVVFVDWANKHKDYIFYSKEARQIIDKHSPTYLNEIL